MQRRRPPLPQKTPRPHAAVICECGGTAAVVTGAKVYPHRPDLHHKFYWRCPDCGGYVGVHQGTLRPLGTPSGPATRKARLMAHDAFDPLWRARMRRDGCSQSEARGAAYAWLADQLGLDYDQCHIGLMDRATALRVVDVCRRARAEAA